MASSQESSLLHSILTFKSDCSSYPSAQASTSTGASNEPPSNGVPKNETDEGDQAGKAVFHVDKRKISAVAKNDQDDELQFLGIDVYNHDEFEQGVMDQVDDALAAAEEIRLNKALEKEMKAIQDDVRSCQEEVTNCEKVISDLSTATSKDSKRRLNAVKMQRDNKLRQLKRLQGRQKALIQKTQKSLQALEAQVHPQGGDNHRVDALLGVQSDTPESAVERMMRLGEMTPFGTALASQGSESQQCSSGNNTDFEKYLMDQQTKGASRNSHKSKSRTKMKKASSDKVKSDKRESTISQAGPSAKIMKKSKSSPSVSTSKEGRTNYFDSKDKKVYRSAEKDFSNYKSRTASFPQLRHNFNDPGTSRPDYDVRGEYDSDDNTRDKDYQPEFDAEEEDESPGNDTCEFDLGLVKERVTGKKKKQSASSSTRGVGAVRDDGDSEKYFKRIKMWHRLEVQKKQERLLQGEDYSDNESDMEFEGGFRVPAKIWKKLYRFQKTGVKWLWELHTQQCGGIIGDEMGLGKTIQMISFLVGLHYSKLRDRGCNKRYTGLGPCIIICPTTVMHQWVKEFHAWWPLFRVAILHNTGTFNTSEKELIHDVANNGGIIITSYSGVVIHQEVLLRYNWHYIILDEGHKIRNPDAQATLAVKQFRTPHRIILTGSPLQNNLKELWSLFDFVFPGKLGTLPDFLSHFSVPIVQGGYSNATQVQVQTAYKCACVLRDTINPYLIRRMKADVKTSLNLPQKNEQVLFCRLTDHQKEIYQEYLDSKECQQILRGNYMIFPGLITMRKICNHPDISTGGPRLFNVDSYDKTEEEMEYGYHKRSGKMIVIEALLKIWKKQQHKVLMFCQGQKMLDILETFVQKQRYTYLRMDGKTGISARQPLINKFNQTPELFIFLLTTRVGGLGVNLTGADRVVIVDPDWNPSTDTQARERAWRIGQQKEVTIYRLITTGTIEEKIYHRQIFKQFLSNRVLKDPKQRRFFKSNDLFELFMLGSDDREIGTETSAIFAGTGSDIKVTNKDNVKEEKPKKNRFDALQESHKSDEDPDFDTSGNNEGEVDWDNNKLDRMRDLAKKLSLQFSVKSDNKGQEMEPESKITDVKNESEITGTDDKEPQNESGLEKPTSDEVPTSISVPLTTDQGGAESSEKSKMKATSHDEEKRRKKKQKEKKRRKEEEQRKKKEQERRKKKKAKKRKNAKFEGTEVAHLDRSKTYQPPGSDGEDEPSRRSEDYVLKKLFQKSDGLHSAMQHDNIMLSSHPDYALVEGEAERVARDAARALKRSRQQCHSATSGMPTWTGHSGVSKLRFGQKKNPKLAPELPKEVKPSPVKKITPVDTLFTPDPVVKHFDGTVAGNAKITSAAASGMAPSVMSSKELLERMRTRNFNTQNQRQSDSEDDDEQNHAWRQSISVETNPDFLDLITDIRNHVAFGCSIDGQATTDELLEHFHERLPPKDSALFKAMLKQICEFSKREGIGIWRLRIAFR